MFLTLDLTKGYHQMNLAEEFKEVTAFMSPRGPFSMEGFANGDEDFQSRVSKINGLDVRKFAAKMCCSIHR